MDSVLDALVIIPFSKLRVDQKPMIYAAEAAHERHKDTNFLSR
jgi:hypothetical protein